MDIMTLIEAAHGAGLSKAKARNALQVSVALDTFGKQFGLDKPHRLVQYLAQLAHESAWFRYDREVWGPTAAQRRYEGRKDLGNTQKGDGKKFAGHGPIQVTGRHNHAEFRDWCRAAFPDQDVPDFEAHPEKINTDPWEGLTGIWYWSTRNLNRYADEGNAEMISRRINGGTNGLADRYEKLVQFSLVALGHGRNDVRGFQSDAGILVDGDAGPETRRHLHEALLKLDNPNIEGPDSRSDEDGMHEAYFEWGYAPLTYTNQKAIRNRPVTDHLFELIGSAIFAVYGPGARGEIYSGGQAAKGSPGKRTGSVRHDDTGKGGRAADVRVFSANGIQIKGSALAPLVQYWLAKGYGAAGAVMRGGGVHLDEWTNPPSGGGMSWTYSYSDGQSWGGAIKAALADGKKGVMPDLPVWQRPQVHDDTAKPTPASTPQPVITALVALIAAIAAAFGGDAADIISKLTGG